MTSANTNDIKRSEIEYKLDDTQELAEGFQYPKNSKAFKAQRMVVEKKGGIQILKREDSQIKEKRVPIDPKMISVLIGAKGRNISLICRHSHLYSSIEDNSTVVFSRRTDTSDLDKAHRMMVSMISGGVLRWFNHPNATDKYYHVSVRPELENMVSATSECTLELLRARNGHLCLLILATPQADLQHVEEQIRTLRPAILDKIKEYAHDPSTNDPTYTLSRSLSDV